MSKGETIAFLQARMKSTRLPGKVMKPILGEPMLWRQIERLRRVTGLKDLVVLTSNSQQDDEIALFCEQKEVNCFRGSESDVLGRFYQAAEVYSPDIVVRVTGDCPLIDSEITNRVIEYRKAGNFDYVSNALEPTFPDGLDTEVFLTSALIRANNEAIKPHEREHVTPYIYNHKENFNIGSFKGAEDFSSYRWTVDEPKDFEFVEQVYSILYPSNPQFDMHDVLNLLSQRPDLLSLNRHYRRNEGFERSLEAEKKT